MRKVRREYVSEFLEGTMDGERWADGVQVHHMPISLYGEGVTRYTSRLYGSLPTSLKGLDEHEEKVWLGKFCCSWNKDLQLSMTTSVVGGRTLAEIRASEEETNGIEFKVAGASNGQRTAESLRRKGVVVEKVGPITWSLAVERDVVSLMEDLKQVDMGSQVLIFHCMDNGTFLSLDRNGGSSLPKRVERKFHIPGKLVVASGFVLEQMLEQMLRVVEAVKPGLAVIILPMPIFLDLCCETHRQGRTEERLEEDREKLLRSVWNIKRDALQMMGRTRGRNVLLVSPMEVLGIRSSVVGVRKVMADGVHLDPLRCLSSLPGHRLEQRRVEGFLSRLVPWPRELFLGARGTLGLSRWRGSSH